MDSREIQGCAWRRATGHNVIMFFVERTRSPAEPLWLWLGFVPRLTMAIEQSHVVETGDTKVRNLPPAHCSFEGSS